MRPILCVCHQLSRWRLYFFFFLLRNLRKKQERKKKERNTDKEKKSIGSLVELDNYWALFFSFGFALNGYLLRFISSPCFVCPPPHSSVHPFFCRFCLFRPPTTRTVIIYKSHNSLASIIGRWLVLLPSVFSSGQRSSSARWTFARYLLHDRIITDWFFSSVYRLRPSYLLSGQVLCRSPCQHPKKKWRRSPQSTTEKKECVAVDANTADLLGTHIALSIWYI